MRHLFPLVLFLLLPGCGPLFAPMTPRLNPDQQQIVDQMWDNLLTPIQRVDRQTLLDANVAYWTYVYGVDRMHMTGEKYFSNGTVIMEIDCDRANPDIDQYTITVQDNHGHTLRRERYTRADVEDSSQMMHGLPSIQAQITVQIGNPTTRSSTQSATQPTTGPSLTPKQQALLLESQRRQAAVAAATQPAH